LNDERRLELIVDYIIAYHGVKTFNKEYSALFATTSIETLIKYYELFRKKKEAGQHDLRIATIFTYGVLVFLGLGSRFTCALNVAWPSLLRSGFGLSRLSQ